MERSSAVQFDRPAIATFIAALLLLGAFGLSVASGEAAAAAPAKLWKACENGSGAGQCDRPNDIATNPQSGHLYVSDEGNHRIVELTAWGEFVRAWGWGVRDGASELQTCTTEVGCRAGIRGGGAGQMERPQSLATDSAGNVYVRESDNLRVQKFGPEGDFLLMVGGDVNKTQVEAGGTTAQRNLCTASSGDICQEGAGGVTAGQLSAFAGQETAHGITVAPGNRVYVGDQGRIQEFTAAGAYQRELPFPGRVIGDLAPDPDTGDLYVSFRNDGDRAFNESIHKFTSNGDSLCSTEGIVQYGAPLATDSAGTLYVVGSYMVFATSFDQILAFDSDCTVKTDVPAFGKDELTFGTGGVATGAACYTGESGGVYIAAGTSSGRFVRAYGPPPDRRDLCPPPPLPPGVSDQHASSVGITEAKLQARINPNFWADTTYYVEYGTQPCSTGGCDKQPLPGQVLGAGSVSEDVTATVLLGGLSAGTRYHYRFVATSHCKAAEPEEECTTLGSDRTFITYRTPGKPEPCANDALRTGLGTLLSDCRAYELVSPLDKEGGDIVVLTERNVTGLPTVLSQSAISGAKLTYGSYRAFGDAKAAPVTSQYIAVRGATEWKSHGISPARTSPISPTWERTDTEFAKFSSDLCDVWLRSVAEPPLALGAPVGFPDIYRWQDPECGDRSYQALNTVVPPLMRGVDLFLELQGTSADGSVAIFAANDKLTANAPAQPSKCVEQGGCESRLYASRAGQLRFLCILPNGAPASGRCTAGGSSAWALKRSNRTLRVDDAISADGNRVYWSAANDAIYLRENPFGGGASCVTPASPCTVPVAPPGSVYWGAAEDGSSAIYSTGAVSNGTAELYRFDAPSGDSEPIAGQVYGVAGMSEDAARVYVISKEVLDTGASAGRPNLYLHEDGEAHFIATLSMADVREAGAVGKGGSSVAAGEPWAQATRVTPDGAHVAFMSSAPLSGRDNTDAVSGEALAQVFLYDAEADELVCASCNPSEARPRGGNVGFEHTAPLWVAARIPTWQNSLSATRPLADDGSRLFFESYDSLVLRDTNGRRDVYQWERAGAGGCDGNDSSYSDAAAGCIDLISSGKSQTDASFLDASPSGNDVFFTTLSSLLPHDYGLVDVYDARVGGGQPIPATPTPECEGESCQSPPPPPAAPAPASLSYRGPGDVTAAKRKSPRRCAKAKRKVKSKSKAGCTKRRGKSKAAVWRVNRDRRSQR